MAESAAAQSAFSADGTALTYDPQSGQPLLAAPNGFDQKIDIARIEGQVSGSSVKRVADFVEKHPDESVAILRSWLHEA